MDLIQYSIVLVNLDPSIGSEVKETRPCVIVSPDEMNRHLNIIVVVPMTTTIKKYPTRFAVLHNGKKGMAAIDQIRAIDKKRIDKIFGKLSKTEIQKCKSILKETFVD